MNERIVKVGGIGPGHLASLTTRRSAGCEACHMGIPPICLATLLSLQRSVKARAAGHFRKKDDGKWLRTSKRDGDPSGKESFVSGSS